MFRTPPNPIILGLSWLEKHNPSKDWRLQRMTFSTEHSKSECCRQPQIRKSIFIRARAFVRSSKEGTAFVMNATPTSENKVSTSSIPKQYEDFENIF
jgi:hypothetical protein